LSDEQYCEAALILQPLNDNVALWNEEQSAGKETSHVILA
jgi:hypothetical protein